MEAEKEAEDTAVAMPVEEGDVAGATAWST